MAGSHRVVWKLCHELPNRLLRFEPDCGGVGPHERAREDTARQARDVVPLERFERPDRNLRGIRNFSQRDAALLAHGAQLGSKIGRDGVRSHGREICRYVSANFK